MPPQALSSSEHPSKRARKSSPARRALESSTRERSPRSLEEGSADPAGADVAAGKTGGYTSNFRNVSACNRCRLRKNRCDQRLPSCASCEKANVRCVGYDPITKREIPRSYVFYLEARIGYLEQILRENSIPFAAADALEQSSRPGPDPNPAHTPKDEDQLSIGNDASSKKSPQQVGWNKKRDDLDNLNQLGSNIGTVAVHGASDTRDARHLGATPGISFARVVFAAVKSSVTGTISDKGGVRTSRPSAAAKVPRPTGTSMRDSVFGLPTKPTVKQAPFPDLEVGKRLVDFYFEHANPQIPILHRGEFMKMFNLAYAEDGARVRTPKELYMLNIVFAIGSGIFLGDTTGENVDRKEKEGNKKSPAAKQSQPEEYHAAAIIHLESCLSLSASHDRTDGFGGGLEELQAVLLLAGFALLRPVAPGLWYIIGGAVRLAVDLGLYYEDGKDIDTGLEPDELKDQDTDTARLQKERSTRERGRREWVRDFRRRLWWCTYSFDRLVSTCVGRPVGIPDQAITTEFPSLLDDKYITPSGFRVPPGVATEPSYKNAAHHYFRLRLLQSEILQVLNYQQAQVARSGGVNGRNPYIHYTLSSPFLAKFDSFRSWRIDIDKRLYEWKSSAPTKRETGVGFSVEFLELNYWQCVIMLYRQSLSVPAMFEGEYNTSDEMQSPGVHNVELIEDEERVFLKVAEAGQRVLRLYRQLHRVHLVNYTFLSTHHLFMAGISFLYAIWHSPTVRSRLTMDEVDFTILAATSVLGDLIEKCPPAEACRDAFNRMSKATVQMCMSTTGFSSSAQGLDSRREKPSESDTSYLDSQKSTSFRRQSRPNPSRPMPTFDMGLHDILGPVQTSSQQFRSQTSRSDVKNEHDNSYNPQSVSQGMSQAMNSPPLSTFDASSIDPSLLPPSNSPHSDFSNANPPNGNTSVSTLPYTATSQYPTYQDSSFAFPNNYQGTEFMPNNGWGTSDSLGFDSGSGNGGFTFGGGDFGMGLGWEGMDHDFSEGGQVPDLFDGFFFGGAGNA